MTWRRILYINVPIGAVGFIASSRVFARAEARTREPLDLLGAALIAAGLSLLTVRATPSLPDGADLRKNPLVGAARPTFFFRKIVATDEDGASFRSVTRLMSIEMCAGG